MNLFGEKAERALPTALHQKGTVGSVPFGTSNDVFSLLDHQGWVPKPNIPTISLFFLPKTVAQLSVAYA